MDKKGAVVLRDSRLLLDDLLERKKQTNVSSVIVNASI